MRNQDQNRYPLSHFLRKTSEHMERLADGQVETITRNGKAILVAMSPETYDAMRMELERDHRWGQAIRRYDDGERGVEATEVIDRTAKQDHDKT